MDGKQLSSLSFPVAECDRIGKPSCTPTPCSIVCLNGGENVGSVADGNCACKCQTGFEGQTCGSAIDQADGATSKSSGESDPAPKVTTASNTNPSLSGDEETEASEQTATENTGTSTTEIAHFSSSLRYTPTVALVVISYLLL